MIGLTSNRFHFFKPSHRKIFKDLTFPFYPKRFDIERKKHTKKTSNIEPLFCDFIVFVNV